MPTANLNVLMWLCGLPRRCSSDDVAPAGRVTRILLVAMVLGTLVPLVWPDVYDLAYRADRPFAAGGLPLIFSFALHGGLLHGFVNAAFLLLFGDEVEDEVGSLRFACLVAASDVIGTAAETALVGGYLPMVGASAGISGALAAYVILFPRRELEMPTSWVFPIAFRGVFWWPIRVPFLLVIWLVEQVVGLMSTTGDIAFAAHIGGALTGAGLALWWRRQHE